MFLSIGEFTERLAFMERKTSHVSAAWWMQLIRSEKINEKRGSPCHILCKQIIERKGVEPAHVITYKTDILF